MIQIIFLSPDSSKAPISKNYCAITGEIKALQKQLTWGCLEVSSALYTVQYTMNPILLLVATLLPSLTLGRLQIKKLVHFQIRIFY
jgi:hypothetical protein